MAWQSTWGDCHKFFEKRKEAYNNKSKPTNLKKKLASLEAKHKDLQAVATCEEEEKEKATLELTRLVEAKKKVGGRILSSQSVSNEKS